MDFPGEGLWVPLDRLTYYIFFPALLLHTLATANLADYDIWPMASALGAGLFSMVAILMLLKAVLPLTGPQFSSVFQGAARWNGFVALAAIGSLFGPEGVTLAAVSFAVLVPTVNVLSVLILTRYAGDEPAGMVAVLRLLSKNPLILACAAGVLLNVTGIGLPGPLAPTFDILGAAALTIGLIAIGAGLQPAHALETGWIVALTSGLKLLVMPRSWRAGASSSASRVSLLPSYCFAARCRRNLLLHPRPPARRRRNADGKPHHRLHHPRGHHDAADVVVVRMTTPPAPVP